MDFAFSAEQEALASAATDWLADKWPLERVLEVAADPEAAGDSWDELADLGWLDDELTLLELAILAERTGGALLPVPWLTHVAMAAPVLGGRGGEIATLAWADAGARTLGAAASTVDCRAEQTRDGWRLSGVKQRVPSAATARYVVVVAEAEEGVGLFVTSPRPKAVNLQPTIDETRPYTELTFDSTAAEVVIAPGRAKPLLHAVRQETAVLLACEGVGVLQKALDLAVEHASTRTQFGKPIGTFQAVAHPLADTYADLQLARSLAYRAAWAVHTGTEDADEAVAAAAACVAEVAPAGCERAIQTLGGLGFTWESPLHRWYKRAQWIASWEGSARTWRGELATLILG